MRRALDDPFDLVEKLGLTDGMKRQSSGVLVLCPHHAERHASCSITRGADGTVRVKCHGCGWSGDVLHLIAEVNQLDLRRDFARVVELGAQLGGVTAAELTPPPRRPAPPPPEYVPEDELERFWAACQPPNLTSAFPHLLDLAVAFYFARRRWFPPEVAELDLVRVTPLPDSEFVWPPWWPRSRAAMWRIVMRAYDAKGRLRSVQGRAIDPDLRDKTRWPYDRASSGLFFANRPGIALLAGQPARPVRVELMEGLSDTLVRSVQIARQGLEVAVLGLTQGSPPALADVAWSEDVPVIVVTHADPTGERLAAESRRFIPAPVDVRRADMSKLVPVQENHGRV